MPQPSSPQHPSAAREFGLDWLRVFAFSLLILYHTGMIFVRWPFHIKNAETSIPLEWLMLAVNRWRLPLLFFVAGVAVSFSLRRRSYRKFAAERFQRLFLPLVFGMFVIVPPQIYLERLFHGATLSYAEWYPSVFEFRPYPQGSLSWHHLWFVLYIFVYSLAGIPFFRWVRSAPGRRAIDTLVDVFERRPLLLYTAIAPSLFLDSWLGPHWPTTNNLVADWNNLLGSFLYFLWGFIIGLNPRFLDLITRRRHELALSGLAFAIAFFAARAFGSPGGRQLSVCFGFTWVLALAGLARHHFREGGPKLRYATQIVYPLYIFHQTVLIAAGYYVIQQPWGVWPKFALVALITFLGSWLAVEAVRRFSLTRLLFGLKA